LAAAAARLGDAATVAQPRVRVERGRSVTVPQSSPDSATEVPFAAVDRDPCGCGHPVPLSTIDYMTDRLEWRLHELLHSMLYVMLEHERAVHGIPNIDTWVALFGGHIRHFEWVQEDPDLGALADVLLHKRMAELANHFHSGIPRKPADAPDQVLAS
jgi:hypothetical protein